ncbi:hypothetical protein EVAR_79447_1 [Eumeta japonica]|uniref:Uncharacterized protein n=1 Tax=Eumeta variegata TaxID=151549 RepID=A0A4C1UDX3_EUMVA|nr:hypothetical protein EVAR_79447_1 [Eumeta japonica]
MIQRLAGGDANAVYDMVTGDEGWIDFTKSNRLSFDFESCLSKPKDSLLTRYKYMSDSRNADFARFESRIEFETIEAKEVKSPNDKVFVFGLLLKKGPLHRKYRNRISVGVNGALPRAAARR